MLKRIKELLSRRSRRPSAAAPADGAPPSEAARPPVQIGPRVVHRPIPQADLDPDAVKIVQRLTRFDHAAYLVGGCVRDLLLEHRPKDFDIGTSATPRQIKRLFRNSRIIGRRFRLAHIYFQQGKIIEVATFRSRDGDDSAEGDQGRRAAGKVVDAKVPTDRETGRPRGFAFVEFENEDGARRCIEQMNGQDLKGRPLRINAAEDRPPRAPGAGGGGFRPGPPGAGPEVAAAAAAGGATVVVAAVVAAVVVGTAEGAAAATLAPRPGAAPVPRRKSSPRSRRTRAGGTSAFARSPRASPRVERTRDGAATRSSTTRTTEPAAPLRTRRRRPARPLSPGSGRRPGRPARTAPGSPPRRRPGSAECRPRSGGRTPRATREPAPPARFAAEAVVGLDHPGAPLLGQRPTGLVGGRPRRHHDLGAGADHVGQGSDVASRLQPQHPGDEGHVDVAVDHRVAALEGPVDLHAAAHQHVPAARVAQASGLDHDPAALPGLPRRPHRLDTGRRHRGGADPQELVCRRRRGGPEQGKTAKRRARNLDTRELRRL